MHSEPIYPYAYLSTTLKTLYGARRDLAMESGFRTSVNVATVPRYLRWNLYGRKNATCFSKTRTSLKEDSTRVDPPERGHLEDDYYPAKRG